jgi:hypothetical protein
MVAVLVVEVVILAKRAVREHLHKVLLVVIHPVEAVAVAVVVLLKWVLTGQPHL